MNDQLAPQPDLNEVPLTTAAAAPRRRRLAAGLVGVAAVGASGMFAVDRMTSDAEVGGAAAPDQLTDALVDALADEDMLGVMDLMAPNERETLADPFIEAFGELQRLDVLDDSGDLGDIGALDIQIDPASVDSRVEPTNADDVVMVYSAFDIGAGLDGEKLPVGDLLRDRLGITDADLADLSQPMTDMEPAELPLAAVQVGGRWYFSLGYTAAVIWTPELPETPVALRGADSPEAAVEQFLTDAANFDLEAVIGDLNPVEFEALQRVAPSFLADAEEAIADVDASIRIHSMSTASTGTGDERAVQLTAIDVSFSAEGESGRVTVTPDGCMTAVMDSQPEESFEGCASDVDLDVILDELDDRGPVDQFLETLDQAMSDYENPMLTVRRVGGEWYVSPLATMSNHPLAMMRALTRGEIEALIDDGTVAAESLMDEAGFTDFEFDTPSPETLDCVMEAMPADPSDAGDMTDPDTLEGCIPDPYPGDPYGTDDDPYGTNDDPYDHDDPYGSTDTTDTTEPTDGWTVKPASPTPPGGWSEKPNPVVAG